MQIGNFDYYHAILHPYLPPFPSASVSSMTVGSAILQRSRLCIYKNKRGRVSVWYVRVAKFRVDRVSLGQLPGSFLLRPGSAKSRLTCRVGPGFKTMTKCIASRKHAK